MNSRLIILLLVCCPVSPLAGQHIGKHYVSRTDGQGTIYHTFPSTLFRNPANGPLVFDITYKTGGDGTATVNFTYEMKSATPADSIRFVSGRTKISGSVHKIYLSAEKKRWKHRYSFATGIDGLYPFFDERDRPMVLIYADGEAYPYEVIPSAWRSEAPILDKILQMIRVDEAH